MTNISTAARFSLENLVKNQYEKIDKKVDVEGAEFDWSAFVNKDNKYGPAYRLTLSTQSLELYENEFGYIPDEFLT